MQKNMPAKPTRPLTKGPRVQDEMHSGESYHHEIRIEGKLSGFWGAVAAVLLLVAFMAVLLLGLLTLTVGLWIAFGALLVAIIGAVLRAMTGRRGR